MSKKYLQRGDDYIMNKIKFPEKVIKIAEELLVIIEKYYPDVTKKTFDSFGFPDRTGSPALQRAAMCIYIELLKADLFKNE